MPRLCYALLSALGFLEFCAAFVPGPSLSAVAVRRGQTGAGVQRLVASRPGTGARPGSVNSGPRRSGLSRNVPDEKLNAPRFIDVEDEAYGEVGIAIAKWQRTRGPIYIQLVGGGLLATGFLNYFSWHNPSLSPSALWCSGILIAFLGFALQRGDSDRQRPY